MIPLHFSVNLYVQSRNVRKFQCFISFTNKYQKKKSVLEAGERVQWFRALATLAGCLGSILSTYVVVPQPVVTLVLGNQRPFLTSVGTRHRCDDIHHVFIYTHKNSGYQKKHFYTIWLPALISVGSLMIMRAIQQE